MVVRLVMLRLYHKDGHTTYYACRRTISRNASFKTYISKDSSSRRIVRLVLVSLLKTHNQTNKECLSEFEQTEIVSLV